MRTYLYSTAFIAALTLSASAIAASSPPQPFTATYEVLSGGEPMGEAIIRFKPLGSGRYEYSNQMHGTSGLAAALGANSNDVTRLRWNNGAPETDTYTSIVTALKTKQRTMKVNWDTRQVSVDDGKSTTTYAAAPGMIDRNVIPLVIGQALRGGSQTVSLHVGVKQQVEQQQYKVQGSETIKVPAGSFQAERVTRTDSDKHFDAWYAPKRFPLPVKLAQSEGGDLTLQLVRFSSP